MIKCLSFFLLPSRNSNMPLYPPSVVSQGTCPDSLFIRCCHFKLVFESINELGSASLIMVCSIQKIKHVFIVDLLPHGHQTSHVLQLITSHRTLQFLSPIRLIMRQWVIVHQGGPKQAIESQILQSKSSVYSNENIQIMLKLKFISIFKFMNP